MKDKKNVFGQLHSKEFSVGDIVEWSSWCDYKESWTQNYGVITEIKNELRHNRLVSISKVLPVNGNVEMEHFTMSLRLVSKNKDVKIED
mgnify:FL=1|tara:strand:- start:524 stop:790 length:267 start_codon:yes stop_codon:yes gene_type:complete